MQDLTDMIRAGKAGDQEAVGRLLELIYEDVRAIAGRARHVDRHGETLQPTALANEVCLHFLKDFDAAASTDRTDREFFYRVIGMAMRTILRDHWRSKNTARRGGGEKPVVLPESMLEADDESFSKIDYLALDDAMGKLERFNETWYHVVLHRYYADRTLEETADLMERSVRSIKTDWKLARAWLHRELYGDE